MNYSFNVGSSYNDSSYKIGNLLAFNIGVGVIIGKVNP
jgi:hypothetical protein